MPNQTDQIKFSVGSLVKTRGREWVVLPESSDDLLVLRPLGGSDDEVTGVYLPLEEVMPASFDLPNPNLVGDYRSARLLRDAVRLGFRSSAGPFRSFARIGFEPRPYQLVPLLMGLKLNPVRLLISDDVGIGKTVEAGMIARELLDRGEIERLAVLCPPPLAEQWQAELREKFHIEAELVLSSTAARLERDLTLGESLFERYPYVIVSLDYIKSDRRREEFKRACPEFIIVDEAHTCTFGAERRGRHQRYDLIKGLSENKDRHIVLVTATPHSGKEDAFRSLLGFLDEKFDHLPEDLTGQQNLEHRRNLANHFVQRRRADITHYMDADTPFPAREDREESYKLSPVYKKLFEKVLDYARETVRDTSGNQFHQRVRWWSALALLRSLASSPAAAAATLRNRAATADAESSDEADEIGRRTILDLVEGDDSESIDIVPGSDPGGEEDSSRNNRRRLLEMAKAADSLMGDQDEKLNRIIRLVKDLINDGYQPIVFCRFIPTAEYVAEELRKKLPKSVDVMAVTGTLPPAERVERIAALSQSENRVLVATDCLSEGINLQNDFNAIIHYDLSWNPTRHEQREGRVDRFGQASPTVRVLTYYGVDNQIDGVVLDVLLRKHQQIRDSLGISVPVPANTEQVVEAIFEGLLLKGYNATESGMLLPGMEEFFTPQVKQIFSEWEDSSKREKRSRTMFAQETIKVDEVAAELELTRRAIGYGVDSSDFSKRALQAFGATAVGEKSLTVDLSTASKTLRAALEQVLPLGVNTNKLNLAFLPPVPKDTLLVQRTHPFMETLANHVLETALDPLAGDATDEYVIARRCGVIRTKQVQKRTTVLVLRLRYHIIRIEGGEEKPLLAEDCRLVTFSGSPQNAEWLDEDTAEKLLQAVPEENVAYEQAKMTVSKVLEGFAELQPHLIAVANQRGTELLDAHQRVRKAARVTRVSYRVQAQLPPDVLGIYVYLPSQHE